MAQTVISISSTVFCGLILWYIKRYFDNRDKKEEIKEQARIKNNVLLLKGLAASLSLGDATAEAIETQHWNGKMKDARTQAHDARVAIDDFMFGQGSSNLM